MVFVIRSPPLPPLFSQAGKNCLSTVGMGLSSTINGFKKMQEEVRDMAYRDVLTGLANRMLLKIQLQQAIAMAKRKNKRVAVVFHDLDMFKPVNDNFGHETGDNLLKAVAGRLINSIRETDIVARIGGDEFVIVLPCISDNQNALDIAEKIHQSIIKPFLIEGKTINISTSIGISIYPDHGYTASELIVNADNAMYTAKRVGRSNIQMFHPEMPRMGRNLTVV